MKGVISSQKLTKPPRQWRKWKRKPREKKLWI